MMTLGDRLKVRQDVAHKLAKARRSRSVAARIAAKTRAASGRASRPKHCQHCGGFLDARGFCANTNCSNF